MTPEVLALHQSAHCLKLSGGTAHVALDAMAGCGGNAIQLTHHFSSVFAIEISPQRAMMTAHNAQLYGVHSKLEVRQLRGSVVIRVVYIYMLTARSHLNHSCSHSSTLHLLLLLEGLHHPIEHPLLL